MCARSCPCINPTVKMTLKAFCFYTYRYSSNLHCRKRINIRNQQGWRLLTAIGPIVTKRPLRWLFIALLLTWMELSYFLMSVILCRTYKKVFYFQMSQTADVSIKVPLIWIHIAHSLNNTGLGCLSVSANLQARIVLWSGRMRGGWGTHGGNVGTSGLAGGV